MNEDAERRIRLGRTGEDAVAEFLGARGFQVVARNVRGGGGEIDIVAAEGQCLIFGEVKTGTEGVLEHPLARVDSRKRARIAKAARWFLQANPWSASLYGRYDCFVVFVDDRGDPLVIYWYPGSFIGQAPE